MINLNVLKHELNFHEWTYFMLYWSGSSLWEKYNILCNFLQLSHPQAAVFAHREGGTLFPKHLLGLVHYLIHTHTHKHTHYICTIYILCINIFVSINLCFFGFVLFFTKNELSLFSLSKHVHRQQLEEGQVLCVFLPTLSGLPHALALHDLRGELPGVASRTGAMQQRYSHWYNEHLVLRYNSRSQDSGTCLSVPSRIQHQSKFNQPGRNMGVQLW